MNTPNSPLGTPLPLTEKSVGHSRALQTVALHTVPIRRATFYRATNTLAEKVPKLGLITQILSGWENLTSGYVRELPI